MDRETETIRVWDPFVRLCHWALVAAFAAASVTAEEAMWLHEILGYAIVALLGGRLARGAVGPRHARFESFVRGRGTVAGDLKDVVLGHARAGR